MAEWFADVRPRRADARPVRSGAATWTVEPPGFLADSARALCFFAGVDLLAAAGEAGRRAEAPDVPLDPLGHLPAHRLDVLHQEQRVQLRNLQLGRRHGRCVALPVFPGPYLPPAALVARFRSRGSHVSAYVLWVRAVDPAQRKPYKSHKLRRSAATMGEARVGRSAPSDFLRKSTGSVSLPSPTKFKYPDETKKPSVPRKSEQPVHGLTTSKNFITSNAIENILAEPPKLKEYGSDQFLYKKEFGTVPAYLRRMKARHGAMMESLQQQEMERIQREQDRVKLLSTDERGELVRQLKAKWDSVAKEYQKSSTLDLKKLDTMGKVRRKEQYEAELQQIESYIDRLASKRHVFVTA